MKLESLLMEVVDLSGDLSIDDMIQRLEACKRAMGLVNQLQNPEDKKKWRSSLFTNLNKVRGALQRMMRDLETSEDVAGGDVTQATQLRQRAAAPEASATV